VNQPTLANVPGIFLRTILRLISRVILIAAGVFFLVGIALAFGSLLLATWRTPRSRRAALTADIVLLATEFAKDHWRVRDKSAE